jgi:hypothetical protein
MTSNSMGASSPFARIAGWEPLDKALISDPSELIAKLRAGGTFHCHKGVPIDRERPVIHGDQLHHEA